MFASSAVWLTAGAVAGEVAILWFGIFQVLLLAAGYSWIVLSALALDRRFVTARVVEQEGERGAHVVGDSIDIRIAFDNDSKYPVHALAAEPYGSAELEWSGPVRFGRLAPGQKVGVTTTVEAHRAGRWMVHGFDVTAADPLGLVRASDYIPCIESLEFYPEIGALERDGRRARRLRETHEREGRRRSAPLESGVVTRELREYQPGDPLRHVAWKATARTRRLISRDFDDEVTTATTLMVDISGSMRGGPADNQKLDHAIEIAAGVADELVSARNRVGLVSFDEKVYGYLPPSESRSHYRRILHHLLGLHSVVDPALTEWGDDELAEFLADYLLVQERLDFRQGDSGEVDRELLDRWVESRLDMEREVRSSPVIDEGIVDRDVGPLREFAKRRGLDVPYRGESQLGPKGRGIAAAFEHLVECGDRRQLALVVTDLCGITNLDDLDSALALADYYGYTVRFLVPFTPAYYADDEESDEKREILLELFSASEREERMENVSFLRSRGIDVQFVGPDSQRPRPMA